MKNQFVWLRYHCGHSLSELFHTTQLKCVLAYAGSWPVMNWCPINVEINNSCMQNFPMSGFGVSFLILLLMSH